MVKIERNPVAPADLAIEKAKSSGTYDTVAVRGQLRADSHNKCYLCERKPPHSPDIEHLRPHKKGKYRDLMFDWNNLFYSCHHCNLVKNRERYEQNVLDCCRVDPETVIHQSIVGSKVKVTPIVSTVVAENTAQLVEDCFELRNTSARIFNCQDLFAALQDTMIGFYKKLKEHKNQPTEETLRELRGMLSREYQFAGFTRTYVRDHLDKYPDLASYVELNAN